ncbi:uncharacterized protein LOC106075241 [Biomphalaria glabrata]|uniref:Uncharacterized protein LOC106075241 n=1 Tax=Biomphalaria glabrata TaxID=6526 RepID=A0A9W2YGU2_BIOGL|nr:uncharacterized protein LOC106075241 [Biomphalaria glabrata]
MSCRRQWRNFLKKRVFIFIIVLTMVSIILMYHALWSHNTTTKYEDVLLSVGQKQRYQPKHSEQKEVRRSQSDHGLNTDLYQNLVPLELDALQSRDLLGANVKEALTNLLLGLYPLNWANAPDADEMALEVKHTLLDYGFDSNMTCKDIDSLQISGTIYASRSKYIDQGAPGKSRHGSSYSFRSDDVQEDNSFYAVRSVIGDMSTKVACLKQIYDVDLCSTMGVYRLLREVLLLSTLHHPSIIRLNGFCLRGSRMSSRLQDKGAIIVTEMGVQMSQEMIYSSTWAQRVKYALQLAHLLNFMDRSLYGSLAFSKLDLKDFVVVGGQTIKLTDLDDIEVGEKTCTKDSECTVSELNKGVACKKGICQGLNSMNNLYLATEKVLIPLLYNPSGKEATEILNSLKEHSLNTTTLVSALTSVFKSLPIDQLMKKSNDRSSFGNKVKSQDVIEMNKENLDQALASFVREDKKNYPGLYDYYCPQSRVKWGCVINVRSLLEAANLCLDDLSCQAFITFSLHPETEKIMTIVLKNQTDDNPYTSSGTTLFLKRTVLKSKNNVKQSDEKAEAQEEWVASTDIRSCVDSVRNLQESARNSRESRLMTHLGLKNIREQSWRKSALSQNLEEPNRIARLESGGGRFQANLVDDGETNRAAAKVTFIAEEGPKAYHKAYAILYHLDRLLGLYHIPPCVGKTLSSTTVETFKGNIAWGNIFRSLIQADGTLKGVMVVPTPKVMKINKLTLKPRTALISDIVIFDRPEKLQLEYIILWWLGRMNISFYEHLGFKGHLIHFSADKAFSATSLDLSDYMNYCQFPNVAYKSLGCFRCVSTNDSKKVVSKICGLGDEVLKQAHSLLGDEADIVIHDLTELDITKTIDSAASDMLSIIDKCVKIHGRDSVLY